MIDTGCLLASETKYKRLVILKSVSIVNPLLSSTISVVADGEFRDVNTGLALTNHAVTPSQFFTCRAVAKLGRTVTIRLSWCDQVTCTV